MFVYFGRKSKAARTYPAPRYPLVIEPFAGSMAYSLHWRPKQALGIERDERLVQLWNYLCSLTLEQLATYWPPISGEYTTDPWHIMATVSASTSTSYRCLVRDFVVQRFGEQQRMAIRHHGYASTSMIYAQGDYRMAPDVEATWFIDPPYQQVRNGYRFGSDLIDYAELARWCRTRKGQVIVCEGPGATWLPFWPHRTFLGRTVNDPASRVEELIWIKRRLIKVPG